MARHIYVHNPFCARKCPYCDFYSITDSSLCEGFYRAAEKEVRLLRSAAGTDAGTNPGTDRYGRDTVYFGGGTPSLPNSRYVASLLRTIREVFDLSPDSEMTIEANPSSLAPDKLSDYREAGFNRISLGVQSLDDEVLKTLGRLHDSQGAIDALFMIREAGFTNVSADLITGVPGQTVDGIKKDLQRFYELGVKHISTYSLSLEEGTQFYDRYRNSLEDLVPPDTEREMYYETRRYLQSLGFEVYEISNSCLPGYKSIHNSSYWDSCEYFAIGAGAHGYLGDMRYGHRDDVRAYTDEMKLLSTQDYKEFLEGKRTDFKSLYVEEMLTEEDKMKEVPFLRLRTSEGIRLDEFKRRFGVEFEDVFSQAVESNIAKGLLERGKRTLRLTRSGRDLANQVMEDFL
ncbi:radical SAM family heme chaperone HemW [Butyrivibrio sp. AE2032]|uniref:radical SAM family heme chaperone HemW n=1 Tax=Butyrivibrio sp. AE2032 TaxID=1458463 RepID=UPI00054E68D7|nr:radical SAM family heme chaperone HemW [Butyrivibrio sp. AE2032]